MACWKSSRTSKPYAEFATNSVIADAMRCCQPGRVGDGATLSSMRPTFLAWLVTGLFLAVLIAVVVLSYSPTSTYIMRAGKFFAALIAIAAI